MGLQSIETICNGFINLVFKLDETLLNEIWLTANLYQIFKKRNEIYIRKHNEIITIRCN